MQLLVQTVRSRYLHVVYVSFMVSLPVKFLNDFFKILKCIIAPLSAQECFNRVIKQCLYCYSTNIDNIVKVGIRNGDVTTSYRFVYGFSNQRNQPQFTKLNFFVH